MKPWVFTLRREEFNKLSNGQIVNVAVDRKQALQCYIEGAFVDRPAIIRYPDVPEKPDRSFENIDFTRQPFVEAIEDFVISTSRDILKIAPERGITTVVNQIFGKGALEIIEMGCMPVEESSVASQQMPLLALPVPRAPYAQNVIQFPSFTLRRE
jgi:hypothetical protein